MNLTIRQANVNDITAIERMYKERVTYNDVHQIHQWNYEQVNWQAFQDLYRIGDYYIGMVDKQLAAGCFIVDVDALYWPNEKKGAALYLHKIIVDPAFRGCGYADQLITFFKHKAQQEGYPYARIDVRQNKVKLRMMYERNGFKLIDTGHFVPEFTTARYQYTFKR